jgi:hypothetical protein
MAHHSGFITLILGAAGAVFAIAMSRLFHRERDTYSGHHRADLREEWYYGRVGSPHECE